MSYYEKIFTRLSRAVTLDEVIAIRDEAEIARIKARLAGDLQTETLAADIVTAPTRSCSRLIGITKELAAGR